MEKPIQDKLTTRLKNVLSTAAKVSKELKHRRIGTEHILYGMMQETGSLACSILKKFGFTPEFIRAELERLEESDHWKEELSPHTRIAFEKAARTAFQHHHRYIGTEHVLYGIVTLKDSTAYKLLEKSPVDVKGLTQQVHIVLKSTSHFPDLSNFLGLPLGLPPQAHQAVKKGRPTPMAMGETPEGKKTKTPAFDYFTQDLTAAAAAGKFDPVIGRGKEIERVMSILNRKTKNNPILIGEPGTGKTAIVIGLAQRIAAGTVPPKLQGKRILSLDMASILAGTTFRGEFEERLKELMRELENSQDAILFIDELHTIVGAGAAGGSLDAANMLKPALTRGEISVIGATTMDEFRKHIEKDAALERRFQPVQVKEPSVEETTEILKGSREAYEQHHGLTVTDEAIESAVEMSVRYIPDRFLPDKALDLLDEAAATLQLQIAGDNKAKEAHALKQQLETLRQKKEQAIEAENYEEALKTKRSEDLLAEKLAAISRKATLEGNERPSITKEHIAKVVADSTGIPVTRLLKSEVKKLVNLEEVLRQHIVGQEEAIQAVARYVRRSRAGIAHPNRPLGSFIFLGPTGVGKTEMAKVLAREVFENPEALIKVDMSEFMEAHSVSRLIGAPAGYVGYEEGGKLTEAVRRQPYSIILFDEIEKAHRDVHNILLQILDEGQLTDSHGRSVNFRNTIIAITSNIGSHQLAEHAHMGFGLPEESLAHEAMASRYEELKQTVLHELKDRMAPELLGRIDQVVVFAPLGRAELEKITDLHIAELQKRLGEKNINLEVSKGVRAEIAQRALQENKGARPIRRIVQEILEDPIAHSVIAEELTPGHVIQARKTGGRIKVTPSTPTAA
jgi:ATP-dependent Clp protease ATP-binding subunit ClpC